MLKGHCLCGAIRFEVDAAPTNQTICHCSTCRRAAGSPVVGWFSVPPSAYRVVAGTPAGYRSSPHVVRTFCPACGTPLTYQSTRTPHEIDVTTCSLDDPEAVPPRDHTHASSRLSWIKLADGLPTHAELRPKG
ncbi:MAG: GFA family protein [Enhydrobacter sp.]|nr:MAG: GFA family protein [Enhydrobacter sp.]